MGNRGGAIFMRFLSKWLIQLQFSQRRYPDGIVYS
jgi:hypothetical protein